MKTFEFTGAVYDTEKLYHEWDSKREFPYFRKIATVPMGRKDFATLRDAERWFTTNYPCLYRGGGIREIREDGGNCDFAMFAVPGAENDGWGEQKWART